MSSLSLGREAQRKIIHISSALIPLAYYWGAPKSVILSLSAFLAGGFLLADLLRLNFALARKYFLAVFSVLLRADEKKNKLTGATYLFLGMVLSVLLFPPKAAISAMFFATLADPAAALIGKRYGTDLFFDKTIEGALAFYLTAAAVILIFTHYSWLGLGVALLCALIEFLPIPLNDNLTIPLVGGYLLTVLG